MIAQGTEAPSHEALAAQIERIVETYPDALIVGSIGRATVYREVFDDPFYEYRLRDQEPIKNAHGDRGDIDLIGAPSAADESRLGPFKVDTLAFDNRIVGVIRRGGDWVLQSVSRDYERLIDPEVFTPIRAVTIYGVECSVPPAKTQLALMNATGVKRPKDVQACQALDEAIGKGRIDYDISDEALEPFYELGMINSRSVAARIGTVYRSVLPERARLKLAPTVEPIKEYIDRRFS